MNADDGSGGGASGGTGDADADDSFFDADAGAGLMICADSADDDALVPDAEGLRSFLLPTTRPADGSPYLCASARARPTAPRRRR